MQRFQAQVRSLSIPKTLNAELCVRPDNVPTRLNGSGMLVVNPPWQLDKQLHSISEWLLSVLRIEQEGRSVVEWLVGE